MLIKTQLNSYLVSVDNTLNSVTHAISFPVGYNDFWNGYKAFYYEGAKKQIMIGYKDATTMAAEQI